MQSTKKTNGQMHALLVLSCLVFTTSLFFIPILVIGLVKLVPYKNWQNRCTKAIDKIATYWCSINNLYINKAQKIEWNITGLTDLNAKDWHLVIANHQSWLDIIILQRLFNRKIPVLKFFIKDQLKWLPLLGFAWWAMGCPFMKRYDKDYLAKYPHKKGKDVLATHKAIETFKQTPASIMSFIEGTRFTQEKKTQQNSPYTHLLKPKAGGVSTIISSMSQQINSLIDVTIIYPSKHYSLWDFLCKRINTIKITIRQLPIPAQFTSANLVHDEQTKDAFKDWLNAQWAEKDQLIEQSK
jgi:1-acyl-sn-glycerol-3-phosphate acyltransferase